jgi:hypothetical protein
MRRLLTFLALIPLLALGACNLTSHCDENGNRITRLWNDDQNPSDTNLVIIDSNVIPGEDLPLTLVPDTNSVPGEPVGVDSVSWSNDEPIDFFFDYRWGDGEVEHIGGTWPDDCPPA